MPRVLRLIGVCSVVVTSLFVIACGGRGGSSIQSLPQSGTPTPSPSPTVLPKSCTSFKSMSVHAASFLHAMTRAVVPARIAPGPASRVCANGGPGRMHCVAWLRNDIANELSPFGYGPNDLQSAYNLSSASSGSGSGQVVAIVDAFDDPNAESDLAVYRATFGLPACTTGNGCFLKVNEGGETAPLPSTDPTGGWEAEESLDLDMVSAVCPNCRILLVEAKSDLNGDLYSSEDTAATTCGANEISNSWNGSEYTNEGLDEIHFNRPGIMITVASGDKGYDDPSEGYPATSQYVTAVGGTSLKQSGSSWSETVWDQTGSRCSQYIAQPAWQKALGSAYTSVCGKRIDNDVAAIADPSTGVATYDTFGGKKGCTEWCISGGTSVATPIIAAVYALAGNGASLMSGSYPYSHSASLRDVTSGSNGSCGNSYLCTAKPGYDGPTGNGTPNGTGAF